MTHSVRAQFKINRPLRDSSDLQIDSDCTPGHQRCGVIRPLPGASDDCVCSKHKQQPLIPGVAEWGHISATRCVLDHIQALSVVLVVSQNVGIDLDCLASAK